MKNHYSYYLMVVLIFSSFISAFGQNADLTLISSVATPININTGEVLNVTFKVQNIGSSASGLSHVAFYISPTTNFGDGVVLSVVSLETLAIGGNTGDIIFTYPVPYSVVPGNNYVLISIDPYNTVAESNEANNNFYSNSILNVSANILPSQTLPYPIIFVHGLNSNSETWNDLLITFQNYYGWSYGGDMHFCLNQDANTSTGELTNDYYDWTGNLYPADFYRVNFDVNPNGVPFNNTVESNQSAIYKQGVAIQSAVNHVLQTTGKDKVILVGHSMGGLASRTYLQNTNLWQSDGKHHVAKLFTNGTPHGGSNATSFGGGLGGTNELSEAIRDLRYSYYSGAVGAYLFGGNENTTDITGAISNFCNIDVNCNGQIGDNITGLNQKTIPNDLAYSCVIGVGSGLGGDGVVDAARANLNNYFAVSADTFELITPGVAGVWHTELPKQVYGNIKGIDEPYEYVQGYEVKSNELTFGLISEQSLGAPYVIDYDDFKINVSAAGNLNIKAYNIPLSNYQIDVLDVSLNYVYSGLSNGKSYLDINVPVNQGVYYVEFSGTPDASSWYYPYAFKLTYPNTVTNIEITETTNKVFQNFNYPNPFDNQTTISFNLLKSDLVTIKFYDTQGKTISMIAEQMKEGQNEVSFDASNLSSGVYFYTIESGGVLESNKLTVSK